MRVPPLAEHLGQGARGNTAAEDGVEGVRAGLDMDVVLALRGARRRGTVSRVHEKRNLENKIT